MRTQSITNYGHLDVDYLIEGEAQRQLELEWSEYKGSAEYQDYLMHEAVMKAMKENDIPF